MKHEHSVPWFNKDLDKYAQWTIKIADKIKDIYPDCGIGIAGSLALGSHSKKSDIDLLVIDKAVKSNKQCVFLKNGFIETNILYFNPDTIKNRCKIWIKQFNGQHITYIYMSEILYDPKNYLRDVKNYVLQLIDKVQNENKELIENCKTDLLECNNKILANDLNTTYFFDQNTRLSAIINLWFVTNQKTNLSKNDDKCSFETIKKNNFGFYKLLKKVLHDCSAKNTDLEKLSNMC